VATLYEHQKWTRDFAGITDADDTAMVALGEALEDLASQCGSDPDDPGTGRHARIAVAYEAVADHL